MRIALLEDDPDQAIILKAWLLAEGHHCDEFRAGRGYIQRLKKATYDMLLLDWLVPDMTGMEVLTWVRENLEWRIPVIFTTQMDREEDIVQALSHGADDYMVKPVKRRELLARIEALGRRSLNLDDPAEVLKFEPYEIDCQQRVLQKADEHVSLTNIEFDLALFLFRNHGRILSRAYILENVWGRNSAVNTRTVDTHVSRLRSKLGISPESGWRLSPIYQHGYRLEKLTATMKAG